MSAYSGDASGLGLGAGTPLGVDNTGPLYTHTSNATITATRKRAGTLQPSVHTLTFVSPLGRNFSAGSFVIIVPNPNPTATPYVTAPINITHLDYLYAYPPTPLPTSVAPTPEPTATDPNPTPDPTGQPSAQPSSRPSQRGQPPQFVEAPTAARIRDALMALGTDTDGADPSLKVGCV